MPHGLDPAMKQTKDLRSWAKNQREAGNFIGAGLGFNIRRRDRIFEMDISYGARSLMVKSMDSWAILEAIQEVMAEAFE